MNGNETGTEGSNAYNNTPMNQNIQHAAPVAPENPLTKTPAWIGMVQGGVITVCFVLGSVQIDPALFPNGNVEGTGWGWGYAALAGFCAGSLRGSLKERRNTWFMVGTMISLVVLLTGVLRAAV